MDLKNLSFELGGLFLIIFSSLRIQDARKILKNCRETEGVVIGQELEYGEDGKGYYYPQIKLDIADGTSITVKYPDGFYPAKFEINEKIKIKYSIDNPKKIIIEDIGNNLDLIIIAMGIFMIGYGLYNYLIK